MSRLAALCCAACLASGIQAQTIGPQIRVDVNGGTFAANETSCAASEANPNDIVVTWNDWRRSTGSEVVNMGVALSTDGGQTWDDFLIRPPVQFQTGVEGDPMTAFDPRTGDLWVGAIAFNGGGMYVARKRPENDFFDPSVMADTGGGQDKCWMAAGPAPGDPNSTRLYIAYNFGVIFSTDMGATWSNPVNLGIGLGWLPRVGPNGELYVAYWDVGTGMMLRRSFNGGVSYDPAIRVATRLDDWGIDGARFPGLFRVAPLLYLAVDQNDGTLYAVYFDTTNIVGGNSNVDLYFTKSEDQGSTWTTPRVINGDNDPPGDQFFTWIEVDPNGVLHLHYFDSRHTAQNDNNPNGMFDTYYATSTDGGDTWTEFRLTPASFNSILDGLDRGASQFIGDYSGIAVAGGRAIPCYLSTQNGDSDIFVNIITTDNFVAADSLDVVRGNLIEGGVEELEFSDDQRLVINAGITVQQGEPPVWIEVEGTAATDTPAELSFRIESAGNAGSARQTIELFDFDANDFEEIDMRSITNTDTVVEIALAGDLSRFIEAGTRRMLAKVTYKTQGPVLLYPWNVRIDQLVWPITE